MVSLIQVKNYIDQANSIVTDLRHNFRFPKDEAKIKEANSKLNTIIYDQLPKAFTTMIRLDGLTKTQQWITCNSETILKQNPILLQKLLEIANERFKFLVQEHAKMTAPTLEVMNKTEEKRSMKPAQEQKSSVRTEHPQAGIRMGYRKPWKYKVAAKEGD